LNGFDFLETEKSVGKEIGSARSCCDGSERLARVNRSSTNTRIFGGRLAKRDGREGNSQNE